MNLHEFSELQSLARSLATLRKAGRLRPLAETPQSAANRPRFSATPSSGTPLGQVSVASAAPVEPRPTGSSHQAVLLPKAGEPQSPSAQANAPYVLLPGKSLSDRLATVLATLCRRAGFNGALLADGTGLPLAVYRCDPHVKAACGALLGKALDQTNRILRDAEANNIVLEIENDEKIRVRRFRAGSNSFYLLTQYSHPGADRDEVDLALAQLVPALSVSAPLVPPQQ
jgi:hypothetical protein